MDGQVRIPLPPQPRRTGTELGQVRLFESIGSREGLGEDQDGECGLDRGGGGGWRIEVAVGSMHKIVVGRRITAGRGEDILEGREERGRVGFIHWDVHCQFT